MKVLLVNGSPHAAGCVFTALSEVASTLHSEDIETEIFQLGTRPVRGCIACGRCKELGHCVFGDDPANDLIEKAKEADAFVIGSPVYYAAPNGALCAVLDRAFFAGRQAFIGKPAAAVVNCRRGGASAAFDRLNKYFTITQMPVAASQYWNSVHGFTPEDVKKDLEGLQTMRTLAHNMAWMLRGLANEQRPVSAEEHIMTNFIR